MIYIVGIMIIFYALLYLFKLSEYPKIKLIQVTLFYFYICLILFLTIVPINFSLNPNWQSVEPIKYPFDNLKPYNDFILRRSGSLIDIILNLLMMIPFSFLYISIKKDLGILENLVTIFLFSLFIETFQLISSIFFIYGRNFDVTDIINNTLGGLFGYIIYKVFQYYNKI